MGKKHSSEQLYAWAKENGLTKWDHYDPKYKERSRLNNSKKIHNKYPTRKTKRV